MGFPKQSLLYNSFLNVENDPSFLSFKGMRSSIMHLIWTLNFFPQNTFIFNVASWWIGAIILFPEHLVAVIYQNNLQFSLFFSIFFFPCSSLGDFHSLADWKLSLISYYIELSFSWVTGFRCAVLSHSGALQIEPAAPTTDYVSWVLKNQASF